MSAETSLQQQPELVKPTQEEEQKSEQEKQLEIDLKEQQEGVGKNFKIMMGKLGDDYLKVVSKMARYSEYTFTLKKKTGKKMKDPITDEEVDEYMGWETKTFKRNKITTEEYRKVEILRGKYNAAKDDAEAIAEVLGKMYRYLAYIYLQMTEEDFLRSDWEEIKPVLDACNFGTVYSMRATEENSNKNNQAVM